MSVAAPGEQVRASDLEISGHQLDDVSRKLEELFPSGRTDPSVEVYVSRYNEANGVPAGLVSRVTVACLFAGASSTVVAELPGTFPVSAVRQAIARSAGLATTDLAGPDGVPGSPEGRRLTMDLFSGYAPIPPGSDADRMSVEALRALLGQGGNLQLFAAARVTGPGVGPDHKDEGTPEGDVVGPDGETDQLGRAKRFRTNTWGWAPVDVRAPGVEARAEPAEGEGRGGGGEDGGEAAGAAGEGAAPADAARAAAAAAAVPLLGADDVARELSASSLAELGSCLFLLCRGDSGVSMPQLLAALRAWSGFPPASRALAALHWGTADLSEAERCALVTGLRVVGARMGLPEPLARPSVVIDHLVHLSRKASRCTLPAPDNADVRALPFRGTDGWGTAYRQVPLRSGGRSTGPRMADPVVAVPAAAGSQPSAVRPAVDRAEVLGAMRGPGAEGGHDDDGPAEPGVALETDFAAARAVAHAPPGADDPLLLWCPEPVRLPGATPDERGALTGVVAAFGPDWSVRDAAKAAAEAAAAGRPAGTAGPSPAGGGAPDSGGPPGEGASLWPRPVSASALWAEPLHTMAIYPGGRLCVSVGLGAPSEGATVLRPELGTLMRSVSAHAEEDGWDESVGAEAGPASEGGPDAAMQGGLPHITAPASDASVALGAPSMREAIRRLVSGGEPGDGAGGLSPVGPSAEAEALAGVASAARVRERCVVVIHDGSTGSDGSAAAASASSAGEATAKPETGLPSALEVAVALCDRMAAVREAAELGVDFSREEAEGEGAAGAGGAPDSAASRPSKGRGGSGQRLSVPVRRVADAASLLGGRSVAAPPGGGTAGLAAAIRRASRLDARDGPGDRRVVVVASGGHGRSEADGAVADAVREAWAGGVVVDVVAVEGGWAGLRELCQSRRGGVAVSGGAAGEPLTQAVGCSQLLRLSHREPRPGLAGDDDGAGRGRPHGTSTPLSMARALSGHAGRFHEAGDALPARRTEPAGLLSLPGLAAPLSDPLSPPPMLKAFSESSGGAPALLGRQSSGSSASSAAGSAHGIVSPRHRGLHQSLGGSPSLLFAPDELCLRLCRPRLRDGPTLSAAAAGEALGYAAEAARRAARQAPTHARPDAPVAAAFPALVKRLQRAQIAVDPPQRPLVAAVGRLGMGPRELARWLRHASRQLGAAEMDRDAASLTELRPSADDPRVWRITARGPGHGTSPYRGGTWEVELFLPRRFPRDPPSLTFLTPILHPCVQPGGEACLPELSGDWPAEGNVRSVLDAVARIVSSAPGKAGLSFLPHACNLDAAAMAVHEPDAFLEAAAAFTARHAMARSP